MDKNLVDDTNDIIFKVKNLQTRAQGLEAELNSLQIDLDRLRTSLDQAVSVYDIDGQQIVVTQADVELVRAQLNRTYPEESIQLLAIVNKLEAMRSLAHSKGMVINNPIRLDHWILTWGIGLFLYAIICLVVLLAGFFVNPIEQFNLENQFGETVWWSGLSGGIGGTVGLLYILAYIRPKRRFNHQYTNALYYLVRPIIGIVLGIIVFFLVIIGLYFGGSEFEPTTNNASLSIVLSFVVGYQQHAFLSLVERIARRISIREKKAEPEVSAPATVIDTSKEV